MVACPASPHEYIARLPQQGSGSEAAAGEVAEWSIAHAWKACLGLNLTRVRIPLSPPKKCAEGFEWRAIVWSDRRSWRESESL